MRVQIRAGQISIGMYRVPIKIPKSNRHVPIKILKFNRHAPIKILSSLSIYQLKRCDVSPASTRRITQHNTHDEGCDLWRQDFRGEDQKSYSWHQKWATGWPSSTSPTRLRVLYTQYGFLSRVACFWSCSCSQKR